MAQIRNTISLTNNMSPVLKTIMNSMNQAAKVMANMNAQANRGIPNKAFQNASKSIANANRQLNNMNNNLNKSDKFSSKVASNFSRIGFNLTNLASALYLFRNIKDALADIMEAPDKALSTQARIGLFNESPYSKEQLYSQVFQTALKTRTGLQETGDLLSRIMVSGALPGKSGALSALKVTEIINKALVAGGGTAEENRRAILQLSQGLSSGVLQGDELRSLREQVPYLAHILAKGLGNVDPKFKNLTIGDLKDLGKEGELTTDRIIKAFISMDKEVNKAFNNMPKTFGQAMTQITSVWQYFLYMLSQGDGALARINKKAWEFADFLTTTDGQRFLDNMANVFNFIIDVLGKIVDVATAVYQFFDHNTNAMIALVSALGTVLVITAVKAIIAWIAVAWPILLIMALVFGLIYLFLELGYTIGEIIGAVAGAFFFIAAVLWDILAIAAGVVISIIAIVINIIIWVAQTIISILALIGNTLIFIFKVLAFTFGLVIAAIRGVIMGIVGLFQGMANVVLGIIWAIAKAIDVVFGSNLASSVSGFKDNVNDWVNDLYKKLDPRQMEIFDKEFWAKGYIDMDQASTLLDKYTLDPLLGKTIIEDLGILINPFDAYDFAFNPTQRAVDDFFNKFKGIDGIGNDYDKKLQDILNGIEMKDVVVRGGDLDSVGKIKGSVDLSDEDIQLLRDMAAREFLLNYKSVTPVANIKFGDIRETADVKKILEVIEDMVDEALATALVEEA